LLRGSEVSPRQGTTSFSLKGVFDGSTCSIRGVQVSHQHQLFFVSYPL
jgi:hypothetical protein